MYKTTVHGAVAAALLAAGTLIAPLASADSAAHTIGLKKLLSVTTSTTVPADGEEITGAEVVAYDPHTQRAFAINSTENELAIIDLTKLDEGLAPIIARLSFDAYGAGLNGVAVKNGWVAVAVESDPKTDPGQVVLFRSNRATLDGALAYEVGALPDMLTFTSDGRWLLVANEGEPTGYGAGDVDPEGSISILDLRRGVHRATVRTADFNAYDSQLADLRAQGVRIFGTGASVSQDLEPEYITTRGDTAWVTLQEANAVAVVNIPTATVTAIVPLGTKDHSVGGNGLDPSDRDGAIAIASWPVRGMFMPDAIASFRARDGQVYLVTANEGDARDYDGLEEEVRVGSRNYTLDPTVFPNAAALKSNAALGRLTVTNVDGDIDGDGDFDAIYAFGARSFSIWSASGQLVWDSGDAIEQITALALPELFNAGHADPTFDSRSDNKGPEPEGLAVGRVAGRTYAFVALERIGGVMAWDVTDPAAPRFMDYANDRSEDLGAESVEFVSRAESPTCRPLVLVGNEVSRTVSIYEVERRNPRGKLVGCGRDDDRDDDRDEKRRD